MPLEDLTGPDKYLDAFNEEWPLDDDQRPEGDNHIRGVKNVLVNTFGRWADFFDLARCLLWNVPASAQAQETGSLPSPVGLTAQRPASPAEYDWRWNLDGVTGVELEHYQNAAWRRLLAQLGQVNFFQEDQYLEIGPATGGGQKRIFWADAANFSRRMAGFQVIPREDFGAGSGGDTFLEIFQMVAGEYKRTIAADQTIGLISDFVNLALNGKRVVKEDAPVYEGAPEVITTSFTHVWDHGLSYQPKNFMMVAECLIDEFGWTAGEEFDLSQVSGTQDTQTNQITSYNVGYASATQIGYVMGPWMPLVPSRLTGAPERMSSGGAWGVKPVVFG